MKLHGNSKSNLNDTMEDIVRFLNNGKGELDLIKYLKIESKLPNEQTNPANLSFLYS